MNKTFKNIESKEIQSYDGNSQGFMATNTFTKTRLWLTFFLLTLSININSQVNRKDTKKSVPYKANYQRMTTSSGSYHSFEIRNGELWGWGRNTDGQLGDDSYIDKDHPVRIGTAKNWVSVAAGDKHSVGLKADGSLWGWGNISMGSTVLDVPKGSSIYFFKQCTPTRIGLSSTDWVSIGAGDNYALALRADGTLWEWGCFYDYELLPLQMKYGTPTKVNEDRNWSSFSVGKHHVLALKTDGTLWAWGRQETGQLGNGDIGTNSGIVLGLLQTPLVPVKVNSDSDWTAIAAGGNHSLALKSDGTLWAWGFNKDGQLGNAESTSFDLIPRLVGEDTNWTYIAAGFSHSLALKSDGTLWAWGSDDMGQIGNGGILVEDRLPKQIGSGKNWVSIAAGYSHSMGLQADGSLYAWGYNNYGQLGNHDLGVEMVGDPSFVNLNINKPVQIRQPLTAWISFSVNGNHTIGLKADGTIWENYSPAGILQRVGDSYDWVSAEAGTLHSIGLKADGTIWTWGSNTFGQLGLGDKTDRSIPTMIESDSGFVSISAGSAFSIGLKSDGTLWSWG
ncbi:MAG: hypothetical protein C0412_18455, partial [Flavobacterium sp.]|nr:hypothetical protein [Flavobacterium sp.]